MRGFLHKGWGDLQQKYTTRSDKLTTGEDWMKTVSEIILMMRYDLWINRCKIIKCENEATKEKRQRAATALPSNNIVPYLLHGGCCDSV